MRRYGCLESNERKKMTSTCLHKLRLCYFISNTFRNNGEKWSSRNVFEIPPCACHFLLHK